MKQPEFLSVPLAADARLQLDRHAASRDFGGAYQRIGVETTSRFGRLYRLDGDAMAAEADEFIIHESLVHMVALAHPAPRTALVLGGGDGASARELLKHPGLDSVTVAELDPEVVRVVAAEIPTLPASAFENSRVRLCLGDAGNTLGALQARGGRFDLILFDLTEPDDPACAHLHREDFLRRCAASLTPNGLIHLQLGSPFYQPDKVRALYRRMLDVFPWARPVLIEVPLYGGPWLLAAAGMASEALPDAAALAVRLAERGICGLRYYNPALHLARAALPNYVRDILA